MDGKAIHTNPRTISATDKCNIDIKNRHVCPIHTYLETCFFILLHISVPKTIHVTHWRFM